MGKNPPVELWNPPYCGELELDIEIKTEL